ncbi:hypothetical protein B1B04_01080 [Lysinibacillus sp. KCTC 33748]|nr:hypothetical protein B1B04_01080 [Lysinibacillus sp. KCTC 33748]
MVFYRKNNFNSFLFHISKNLAILSTGYTLPEQEIIRIYGMRWVIEIFFKAIKSLLRLQKAF